MKTLFDALLVRGNVMPVTKITRGAVIAALLASPALASAGNIESGFSPGGTATRLILNAIANASTSIDVAAYSFTSKPIALALVDASRRGVRVRVVADAKANSHYSSVTFLANHGVAVRKNGRYAIMHNKFMVLDGKSVETGSYNYTSSAEKRNAENAVLISDVPHTAAAYTQEFNRLWGEADAVSRSW